MVVAFAPGGPADTSAPHVRAVSGEGARPERRDRESPGRLRRRRHESVTRAEPDGYTLLFGSSSTFAVNPAVMTKLRFDVQKDLRFIRLIAQTPHVLMVRSGIAANSLAEFVELAKAQPGKLFYASSGIGGAIHLGSELFKLETGTSHQPYSVPRRRPGGACVSCRVMPTSSSTMPAPHCRTSRPEISVRWRC